MKTCGKWPIGVCSWSLKTNLAGVISAMSELGLSHIHLDLNAAIDASEPFIDHVRHQPWKVTSTMIGFPQEDYSTLDTIRETGGITPDDCWPSNYRRFLDAIEITALLKVPFLSSHFGFLDMSVAKHRDKFIYRLRTLADAAADKGIILLMETGQEKAEELCAFLEKLNHPALAVNFDPANMVLYNQGNPIEAVRTLSGWIRHVHIKDAVLPNQPGTWGREVVWGDGQVDADNFLAALEDIGFDGALAVEREAGNSRMTDIKTAIRRLALSK